MAKLTAILGIDPGVGAGEALPCVLDWFLGCCPHGHMSEHIQVYKHAKRQTYPVRTPVLTA
jgi:hypothetical protein